MSTLDCLLSLYEGFSTVKARRWWGHSDLEIKKTEVLVVNEV